MTLVQTNISSDILEENILSKDKPTHLFNYELNKVKTKKKVLEGAKRIPYQREDKKGCTNLLFSDGAFSQVVLKAIKELENGCTTVNRS